MKIRTGQAGTLAYACYEKGRGGPSIYHAVHGDPAESCQRTAALLARYAPGKAFTLVSFSCGDWDRDYSPFPAEIQGRSPFSGEGPHTLACLTQILIPQLEEDSALPRMIGGYSLAGLFSLWAACETELFSGVAACSPSLWFPGWEAYRRQHEPRSKAIYLSLGDKEEHTRHPVMSRVGDALRAEYAALCADPDKLVQLSWHPGGHGSQGDVRMAQGLAWLLHHGDS